MLRATTTTTTTTLRASPATAATHRARRIAPRIARAKPTDEDAVDAALKLPREFQRERQSRKKTPLKPLSPAERAALRDAWAQECRRAGLERLAACVNAPLDAKSDGEADWDG